MIIGYQDIQTYSNSALEISILLVFLFFLDSGYISARLFSNASKNNEVF